MTKESTFQFRMNLEEKQLFQQECEIRGHTPADVLRKAIKEYIGWSKQEPSHIPPLIVNSKT